MPRIIDTAILNFLFTFAQLLKISWRGIQIIGMENEKKLMRNEMEIMKNEVIKVTNENLLRKY